MGFVKTHKKKLVGAAVVAAAAVAQYYGVPGPLIAAARALVGL